MGVFYSMLQSSIMNSVKTETYSKNGRSKRLGEILKVFGRYGLTDWFARIPAGRIRDFLVSPEDQAIMEKPAAERLRLALTELGPTFIKLGQVLSTRADMVGPEIARELQKLQSNTPADEPEQVEALIQEEFGKSPEELFTEFDPVAFSSASIGQVHRARLEDGREMVVKVQHVGIDGKVRQDLDLLEDLAKLVENHVPEAGSYQPMATAREFRRTLLKELDFRSERRNMEAFTRNFADDETLHVPEIIAERCSRRVLTMEMLVGFPGSKPEDISASGVDLRDFTKRAANVFLNMILRDGFYHADPHPGNFIILHGGVLGLLDCGMVGRIDEAMLEEFGDVLLALLQADAEELSELLLRFGSAPPDVDRVGFRIDISDLLSEVVTQSIADIELGSALEQISDIMRRYHVVMPSRVALLLKTLIMLEGTSRSLSQDFSLAEVLEPFKEKMIRQRMDPRRWLKKLQRRARDVDRLVTSAPRALADMVDRLQAGTLTMRHDVPRLESTVNRLVAGLLIASLFLGSSLLLSLNVPPQVSGISVFGAVGCLIAAVLGGRFLWSIRRDLK